MFYTNKYLRTYKHFLIFSRFRKGDICELWIKCIKQHNPLFKKTISSNVCGLHFDSDLDYEISSTSICKTKTLKKSAVPSIFNPSKLKYLFYLL